MKKHFIHIIILILTLSFNLSAQNTAVILNSRTEQINEILKGIIESEDSNISFELDSLLRFEMDNHEYKEALQFITNNRNLKNHTKAYEGLLGKFNEKKHKKRKKIFRKKISNGWRTSQQIDHKDKKVILAEGDSWFMYPIILKDIISHLIGEEHYAIFSLAYGGDWLSNIITEETYLDEYEKICPDVILLSGGGNDMVGGNNLAAFLKTPGQVGETDTVALEKYLRALALKKLMCMKYFCDTELGKKVIDSIYPSLGSNYQESLVDSFFKELALSDSKITSKNVYDIIDITSNREGAKYIAPSYITFLNVIQLQYVIILEQIRISNPAYFNDLHIILQGYDYIVPSSKRGRFPLQWLTNSKWGMDNGHWLEYPMKLKGIMNPSTQQNIMKDMIDQYYSVLDQIYVRYDNVSLIDSRGMVDKDEWYNELHPGSKDFRRIADSYKKAIDSGKKDIYRVVKH